MVSHRRAVSTLRLARGTDLKGLAWGPEPPCRSRGRPLPGGAGQVEPVLEPRWQAAGDSPQPQGLRTVARRKPLKVRRQRKEKTCRCQYTHVALWEADLAPVTDLETEAWRGEATGLHQPCAPQGLSFTLMDLSGS